MKSVLEGIFKPGHSKKLVHQKLNAVTTPTGSYAPFEIIFLLFVFVITTSGDISLATSQLLRNTN